MSDQSFFSAVSPFASEQLARRAVKSRALSPAEARESLERLAQERFVRTAEVKESKAPIEHWQHDLETILILLEERHVDARRASDLVREMQREMDQWIR
jgi:Fe2+ or Zn2+ uptake regulation protein